MARAPAQKPEEEPDLLDELVRLNARRQEIADKVKEEALTKAREALELVNSLGFTYRITDKPETPSYYPPPQRTYDRGSRAGTRQVNADRPCPICGFKTDPPHDARRHRGQIEKHPFTDEELEANHMKKVVEERNLEGAVPQFLKK